MGLSQQGADSSTYSHRLVGGREEKGEEGGGVWRGGREEKGERREGGKSIIGKSSENPVTTIAQRKGCKESF